MTLTPTKPDLLSARQLDKVLGTALRTASARVPGADATGGAVLVKWELVGRRAKDLKQGELLAAAITEELGKSGIKAKPAVLGIGKEVICGFFDPENVPTARNF